MAVRGVRVGGLGRTLVDVLDRAGADVDIAVGSPLFAVPSSGAVEQLVDDALTLLGAAFPRRMCASSWRPTGHAAVVRVRGAVAGDDDVLARLRPLLGRSPDPADALVASIPARDGVVLLAVLGGGMAFGDRDRDVFTAVSRVVAAAAGA